MSDDPLKQLGEYLTATEAESLAVLIGAGEHTTHALALISSARREHTSKLLKQAGIGHAEPALSVAVLRGIAGAKSAHRDLVPVWTMPGNEATTGHLTNQFHDIVAAARVSVTCATYNFSQTSNMWEALRTASEEPEVAVCVYVDTEAGDPAGVKARLPRTTVYRSAILANGKPIVSHAKFIVVDHRIVLLTSANFSYSAENRNIEFGLLIRDGGLAVSLETTMANKRGSLYQPI
ncbi:MAG: cardiolipin synthase [Mycolicibacterium rufum]|nr:cardiolipin synthase [Mycolicibacterium rufum]